VVGWGVTCEAGVGLVVAAVGAGLEGVTAVGVAGGVLVAAAKTCGWP